MTIEVGKWYRHTVTSDVLRAVEQDDVNGVWWECEVADRTICSQIVEARELIPWVPRVGEWVREVFFGNSRGPVVRVAEVFGRWIRVVNEAGLSAGGPVVSFEPRLPPAEVVPAPSKPPSEVRTEPPATTVLTRRDDGATCRVCGGPAYLGLGLGPPECCAEPCPGPAAVPGPTVREVWVSREGVFVDSRCGRAERAFEARGQGRAIVHPIREEAVRLWWAGAR